jgi:hypothetical protein
MWPFFTEGPGRDDLRWRTASRKMLQLLISKPQSKEGPNGNSFRLDEKRSVRTGIER